MKHLLLLFIICIGLTTNDNLNIYYPDFETIDLVYGSESPEKDPNITFCCAASFTGERLNTFTHANIAGIHGSNGQIYDGYICENNTGAFIWYDKKWKFILGETSEEFEKIVDKNGMGFSQNIIIYDYHRQPLWRHNIRSYRALCELNNKLCIIQSNKPIPYYKFVKALEKLNVKYAIYLDMGSWKHAWFRKNNYLYYINNNKHNYYTNWIVFK